MQKQKSDLFYFTFWIIYISFNLLPGKRKPIRWVVVMERVDTVLCAISVPQIVGFVIVKKPTQSGSTWNVCNCRVYLQIDVEKLTSVIIKTRLNWSASWKNYLKNNIYVLIILYFHFWKVIFGHHISVTLYILSCSLMTLSVFSLQRGKFIYCLPLHKSIVNTSCPARAANAQTQRGVPQQLPCLTCNCNVFPWIIYKSFVQVLYINRYKIF